MDSPGFDRAKLTEQRLQDVLAAYKELKAENEGFRIRTRKNAERRFEERQEQFVLKFMDILDNFDRALDAAQTSYAGNPLIDGLILVRTQILQTLQEEGLEWIPVVGRPYDPEVAEAVATEPVDEPERHHVKDEMRGYRLNGRLTRAARVVVGKYDGPEAVISGTGDALTAAVLEAASATEAEVRGEPDEPIESHVATERTEHDEASEAEDVPDRHTIANLADAAAEAVAAVDQETKRQIVVVAQDAEAAPAPEPAEESSDGAVDAAVAMTSSGSFEIGAAVDEETGIEDVIKAAAAAVEDDSGTSGGEEPATEQVERPEEDSGE